MAPPDFTAGNQWTYTGISEFVKVIYLTVGTVLLACLVGALATWADISSTAAAGFGYFAGGSILLALVLVAPWTYIFGEAKQRLGSDPKDTPEKRAGLRRATKLRIDRGALGLWAPFVANLIGVGWLIYYSGGIVHSPFTAIPVIMFTLVVLLVDPPNAELTKELLNQPGDQWNTGSRSVEPPKWPFAILGVIALVFFVSMALLDIFCATDLKVEPTKGAGIAVILSTAALGIVVAAITRWNILRKLLASEMPSPI